MLFKKSAYIQIGTKVVLLSSVKLEVNLLDHFDDESLWEESFWVLRDVVLKCITLNSYLQTFEKPQDIYVSHFEFERSKK